MSHSLTTRTRRNRRFLAAAIAIAVVAILTLGPRMLVAPARGAFMRLLDAVTAPLLVWIPYDDMERVLNTAMFVPLGATIALLLHRRLWPLAILAGFAVSATVEYAQTRIPGRVPDLDDVLWNTVGAAIAVVLVTLVRMIAQPVQAARKSGNVTRT